MPKNDDGEFELILGNKQLLSMFFVVVVLLGVFFVMGYIVGRNATPLTAGIPAAPKPGSPVAANPPPAGTSPAADPSTEPLSSAAVDAASQAASETVKAEAPKPEPAKAETPKTEASKPEAKAESAKATAAKAAKKKAEEEGAAAKPARAKASDQPVGGATYLQLTATTKHDADAMVEVLRKNDFRALAIQVPEKPGLYRVLVGPIPAGDVNKTKAELQSKSFEGNRAIKRTF